MPPIQAHAIPRKTPFGTHYLASRDDGLPTPLRRLLLLADGKRSVAELSNMFSRPLEADLLDLADRGLIEPLDGQAPLSVAPQAPAATAQESLPDSWMTASSFMAQRARETLGVMAADVINELEQARSEEAVRTAMSQWYRAMRGSRHGRERADADRLEVVRLLKR